MATMPERMSVLETKVDNIENDVSEIKRDMKVLLAANASGMGALSLLQRVVPWVALGVALGATLFDIYGNF